MTLADGVGLAPQPAFVTARFSPARVLCWVRSFDDEPAKKKQFFTELGYVNEDYVLRQLAQVKDIHAAVEGEAQYAKGAASVDASVVLGGDLLLLEVKSTRPVFAARGNANDYRKHLDRDIGKAFEQP